MESPHITHITHGENLWERLDVLRDSGRHGAKTCHAMASFLRERAALENAYGEALIKASKRAAKGVMPRSSSRGQTASALPLVVAPSLVREGWAGIVTSINSWGKQHVGWALCIDQNIAKTLTEFSEKHKGHVARLWAEAQELVSDLEVVQGEYYRARDAYEQACMQASRLLDDRNKARESAAAAAAAAEAAAAEESEMAARGAQSVAAPTSPTKTREAGGGSMLSSVSKMLERVGEGMAMAVGIAAGDLSLIELEEKVPELLRKVDVTESEYIASIMALNGYTTEFQPEMEAKLKQFQLLEESRIMLIRDVLLRLDQASTGMVECLLGPAGTLEALSIALSRIDGIQDANTQVLYVRNFAGMAPLSSLSEVSRVCVPGETSGGEDGAEHIEVGTPRAVPAQDEKRAAIAQARHTTGKEILELPESAVEKMFEGGREGMRETVRIVQEMCCCLGEVVSVEENHTRDLLRLLERQGYGARIAQSGLAGSWGSLDLHAIGATMEDVGKNVMANMSGHSASSSACAGVVAGEGLTLTNGWNSSAVNKVLVCAEAHSGLAHALADGSCSVAIKAHDAAKATAKKNIKLFAAGSKQLVAAKSTHAKAVSRYDRLAREVHEREEQLAKARVDLSTELQAAGGASIVPEPRPLSPMAASAGTTPTADTSDSGEPTVSGDAAKKGVGLSPPRVGAAGVRRDAPWVLESLGLGQQPAGGRVRALEVKLATQVEERDAAKQAVQDAIEAVEAALEILRRTVKDITLASFAEESSRHTGLSQLLESILSALVETAKVFATEQANEQNSKLIEGIDGRRDVEELVERNVHRVPGLATRGRSGHGDGVGEVMFMAYHSEVLQRERDAYRKSSLSPTSPLGKATQEVEGDEILGLRRAGGGGHPLFTAMAEAALAQAHAKQQKRQILARKEETQAGGDGVLQRDGPGLVSGATDAAAQVSAASLSDGEGAISTRSRLRRRCRRASRLPETGPACLSDSEVVMGEDSISSGSLHDVLRRGSRHGSSHGSRHGSRHGAKSYSRHGSLKSLRNSSKHGRASHHPTNRTHEGRELVADPPDEGLIDEEGPESGKVTVTRWANDSSPLPVDVGRVPVEEAAAEDRTGLNRLASSGAAGSGIEVAVAAEQEQEFDEQRRRQARGETTLCAAVVPVAIAPGDGEVTAAAFASPTEAPMETPVDEAPLETPAADASLETPATEASLETPAASTVVGPDIAGHALERRSRSKEVGEGGTAIRPLTPPVTAERCVTPVDPSDAGDLESAFEFMPGDAAVAVRLGAEAGVVVDVEGGATEGAENAFLPPAIEARTSGHAFIQGRAGGSSPFGNGESAAPTEEKMAPTEERMAPTEEKMAPTEEQVAPAKEHAVPTEEENIEGLVKSAIKLSTGARRRERKVGNKRRLAGLEGRPSLRSLKHRLSHQEDFSSDAEVGGLSSSSDERQSVGSSDSDTGGGVAALYRDSLSSVRVEAAPMKQSSEELSSLSSFDLPTEALNDKVIESYSSALYSGGLPLHGRLYITANYLLFSGWRSTKVVLPLPDVVGVEKTSTLGIVPNALTLIKRDGQKISFGSFLFRDDCYTLLKRLVNVSSSISRLSGRSPDTSVGALSPASVGGESFDGTDDERRHRDASTEPSESTPGVAVARALSPMNRPSGEKFESMLEVVLPCTTAQVFAWLWGRDTTFWTDFLRAQGEAGLKVTSWRRRAQRSETGRGLGDLFPEETFQGQRELSFTHPRTGFVVGPKKVLTKQAQGYRVERRRERSGAQRGSRGVAPMDRVVLCQTTQMESGAPLADHFTILGRMVVTREPPSRNGEPRCRIVVGFNVAFHKSTMLRGAIRSGAAEETRATWKAWLLASTRVVTYQRYRLGLAAANDGDASPPPAAVFELAMGFNAGEGTTDEAEEVARGVEEVVVAMGEPSREVDGIGAANLVAGFVRLPLEWSAAIKLPGVPTVLALLCLLMVVVQRREVQRLTGQVEELTAAVGELRYQIDE